VRLPRGANRSGKASSGANVMTSKREATPNRAVQSETRDTDFYLADRSLRQLLGLYAPSQQREHLEPQLHRLGALIGDRLDDLAHASDRQPPVLHHRDRQGRDRQSILKHPDYREMERLAFGEFELAAMSHRPALRRSRRSDRRSPGANTDAAAEIPRMPRCAQGNRRCHGGARRMWIYRGADRAKTAARQLCRIYLGRFEQHRSARRATRRAQAPMSRDPSRCSGRAAGRDDGFAERIRGRTQRAADMLSGIGRASCERRRRRGARAAGCERTLLRDGRDRAGAGRGTTRRNDRRRWPIGSVTCGRSRKAHRSGPVVQCCIGLGPGTVVGARGRDTDSSRSGATYL